jgi:hypothetical protein
VLRKTYPFCSVGGSGFAFSRIDNAEDIAKAVAGAPLAIADARSVERF